MFKVITVNKPQLLPGASFGKHAAMFAMDLASYTLALKPDLLNIIERESRDIVFQLFDNSEVLSKVKSITPRDMFLGINLTKPHFLSIDYALTMNDDCPIKLIELQGFPSVLNTMAYMGQRSGHFNAAVHELYKNMVLGEASYQNTVMLDLNPLAQRTGWDFLFSQQDLQIQPLALTHVIEKDGLYFYKLDNQLFEIKRVYNRVIEPSLGSDQKELYRRMLSNDKIEWVTHPDWFTLISKSCLPLLAGPSILKSKFFENNNRLSGDTVIKPIWDFGGKGVMLKPTAKDLDSLSSEYQYLEQEKASYCPVMVNQNQTMYFELRANYIWPKHLTSPVLHSVMARSNSVLPIGMTNVDVDNRAGFSIVYY